jgi:hypothetical protein
MAATLDYLDGGAAGLLSTTISERVRLDFATTSRFL